MTMRELIIKQGPHDRLRITLADGVVSMRVDYRLKPRSPWKTWQDIGYSMTVDEVQRFIAWMADCAWKAERRQRKNGGDRG